jgi:hypothetical protein
LFLHQPSVIGANNQGLKKTANSRFYGFSFFLLSRRRVKKPDFVDTEPKRSDEEM